MKTTFLLRGGSLALAAAGLFFAAASAVAATNLYSTHFERSEGYNYTNELVGQNYWICDTGSLGGNGLTTNFLGTQAAYVGLFPLNPPDAFISVWQPLDFFPIQRGLPMVEFSTLMSVIDSTTTNRDDFLWTAYNSQGWPLLTVDFYNGDLTIYYSIGTNDFIPTGIAFTNDVPYDFRIKMDFARNLWSATLSGTVLVTNQPIAPAGESLDLADMDAVWWPFLEAQPGDNFMVFDNYQITADALPPVQLAAMGRDASGQFLLRVAGPNGANLAVEASTDFRQWTSLKTNVVTGGYFDYIDSGARTLSSRYYRARQVF